MQSPQAHLIQIRRILALWPPQAGDSGEELLRSYVLAIEDYPAGDVEAAVDNLIKGVAPGVSPSFRPKPPEVGAECRRVMNLRLDSEQRRFAPRGSLPAPTIERTPESQARVAEMMHKAVAGLASELRTPDAEETRRKRSFQSRVFDRFDPPQTDEEMRQRLGFTVGDPDEERGDMGGKAA